MKHITSLQSLGDQFGCNTMSLLRATTSEVKVVMTMSRLLLERNNNRKKNHIIVGYFFYNFIESFLFTIKLNRADCLEARICLANKKVLHLQNGC